MAKVWKTFTQLARWLLHQLHYFRHSYYLQPHLVQIPGLHGYLLFFWLFGLLTTFFFPFIFADLSLQCWLSIWKCCTATVPRSNDSTNSTVYVTFQDKPRTSFGHSFCQFSFHFPGRYYFKGWYILLFHLTCNHDISHWYLPPAV
jgi:hypothetical protein